jgi:hypothetical protein
MNLDEFPTVFLGGLDEAFPGDASRAEGSHKRVVLAPEDH